MTLQNSQTQSYTLEQKLLLAEAIRRKSLQIATSTNASLEPAFSWRPQEGPQSDLFRVCGFLDAIKYNNASLINPPECSLIGYGGARGGGKTDGTLGLFATACYLQPGVRCVIFRRTLKEQRGQGTAEQRSDQILRGCNETKYNKSAFRWTWNNGSSMQLVGCEHERDVENYLGWQYAYVAFDEATAFTWPIISKALSSNRDPDGVSNGTFALFLTNPGGIGASWYKKLFIESGQAHEINQPLNPDDRKVKSYFIPAKVYDNKILINNDPNYIKILESMDDISRARFLDGNWGMDSGQFFGWRTGSTIDRAPHEIDEFEITKDFKLYGSIDYGFSPRREDSKPFVYLLFAFDKAKHIYLINEITAAQWTVAQQCEAIKELESLYPQRVTSRVACHSMFQHESEGAVTIAERYRNSGVSVIQCSGSELAGYTMIRDHLALAPDGLPWFMSFKRCSHTNAQMLMAVKDDLHPEKIHPYFEEHAIEALRHMLLNRPIAPKDPAKKVQYGTGEYVHKLIMSAEDMD